MMSTGAVKGFSMEKVLCWASMGVSGVVLLLFLLDLVAGIPFGGLNFLVSLLGVLSAGIIAYLSWDAANDVR